MYEISIRPTDTLIDDFFPFGMIVARVVVAGLRSSEPTSWVDGMPPALDSVNGFGHYSLLIVQT